MKTKRLSLEAYIALGIALLAQKNVAGQVIIRDFDPDLRMMNWRGDGLNDATIKIDIDSNGIDDLIFTYNQIEIWGGGDRAELNLNFNDAVEGIVGEDLDGWAHFNFFQGDTISAYLDYTTEMQSFGYASVYSFGYGLEHSYWAYFQKDQYLGLKLKLDGENLFGWLRLSMQTLADEDNGKFLHTGSPITIFEFAYNTNPFQEIIADANTLPELGSITHPVITDNLDANDITDLSFNIDVEDTIDFSELRFFLVPSEVDMMQFSVADALALVENRFLSVPSDSIILGAQNIFQLPTTLKDIHGNDFSSESYYSGFYLKIPIEGDSSKISLSSPLNVIKPALQQCKLELDYLHLYYNQEGFLEVAFSPDLYDEDIEYYGVALAEDWLFTYGWGDYYTDLEFDEIDFSSVISVPKTDDTLYIVNLEGLNFDIYGYTIDSGEIFNPVVLGFADGYYKDLMCVTHKKIYLEFPEVLESESIENSFSTKAHLIQSNTISIQTQIEHLIIANFKLEISSLTGEVLLKKTINAENQTFSFPELPDGIYTATIKENNILIAVSKIILQR